MTTSADASLAPFTKQWAVLLTSYKRDGSGVGTPVNIAVEGDHAYFRTFGKAVKNKRLRNFPDVDLAPCTASGKPTGPAIKARTRLLEMGSDEDKHAAKVLARAYPFSQRLLIPFRHMVQRRTTVHYEVRLAEERSE